jgi:hypothetical protein
MGSIMQDAGNDGTAEISHGKRDWDVDDRVRDPTIEAHREAV